MSEDRTCRVWKVLPDSKLPDGEYRANSVLQTHFRITAGVVTLRNGRTKTLAELAWQHPVIVGPLVGDEQPNGETE